MAIANGIEVVYNNRELKSCQLMGLICEKAQKEAEKTRKNRRD
jgi:hypothetical protein